MLIHFPQPIQTRHRQIEKKQTHRLVYVEQREEERRKTYKTKKYKYTDNCKRKEREERWDNEREKYLLDR
jgi:hypothetical protein